MSNSVTEIFLPPVTGW